MSLTRIFNLVSGFIFLIFFSFDCVFAAQRQIHSAPTSPVKTASPRVHVEHRRSASLLSFSLDGMPLEVGTQGFGSEAVAFKGWVTARVLPMAQASMSFKDMVDLSLYRIFLEELEILTRGLDFSPLGPKIDSNRLELISRWFRIQKELLCYVQEEEKVDAALDESIVRMNRSLETFGSERKVLNNLEAMRRLKKTMDAVADRLAKTPIGLDFSKDDESEAADKHLNMQRITTIGDLLSLALYAEESQGLVRIAEAQGMHGHEREGEVMFAWIARIHLLLANPYRKKICEELRSRIVVLAEAFAAFNEE